MKLHHIAFWTKDMEKMIDFYIKHWHGRILFRHQTGDFSCTFLEVFKGIRIELMTTSGISNAHQANEVGYSHLSVEVDCKEEVNKVTNYCKQEGILLEKCQEQYNDGFYESSFYDPDGNVIEIAYVDRNINPTV